MADQILDGRVLVSRIAEEAVEPGPMGLSRRIVTAADSPVAVNVIAIGPDARRHYHRYTTEIYICTGGSGRIVCDGETIPLTPGVVVTVKPGVVHQPFSDDSLECMIIVSPPFGTPMDRVFTDAERVFA